MESLTREQFHAIAGQGRLIPVYRELAADLETPVSVYCKLRGRGPSFLLESVEKGEKVGRYSILGANPRRQIVTRGRQAYVLENGRQESRALPPDQDPLHVAREEMERYRPVAPVHRVARDLPRFYGGAVGYLGYDAVRFFERLPHGEGGLGLPDLHLLVTDTLLIFDHVQHRLLVFANAHVPLGSDPDTVYDAATAGLDEIEARLQQPLGPLPAGRLEPAAANGARLEPTTPRVAFEAAVARAAEYIAAGHVYQLAPSQRLARPTHADPFAVYRALRRLSPSAYMFFLDLGGSPPVTLIGSSPEALARLENGQAEVRPVTGARPRRLDEDQDRELEAALRQDARARAEHVMLVDLARNDLGRVSRYGTVRVPELLAVERDSQTVHLASRVTGTLREGADAFDVVRAAFPAGTVTGTPKIRAMEILHELEGEQRGPFAGAVGYFGFNGSMDACIATRTIAIVGNTAYVQPGTRVVAESDPGQEWERVMGEADRLGQALDAAEAQG